MIVGLDTTLLVQHELRESAGHAAARRWVANSVERGDSFALAPQVLTEFVHVATDPARFEKPLTMTEALRRSEAWWNGLETKQMYPNEASAGFFTEWMRAHRLGRKRILDTMLAATYYGNGVTEIATSNARDYAIYGVFRIHRPT